MLTEAEPSPSITTGPASAQMPSTRAYRWYVLVVLFFVAMVAYADRQAINVLIAPMKGDLGLTEVEMGVLLGPAFILVYVLAAVPAGRLADSGSARNLLVGGVVVWSVGTLACGYVTSFATALAARALVGLGEACFLPASFALIADYFVPDRRGKATSFMMVGVSLGSGVGYLGPGLMLQFLQQHGRPDLGLIAPQTSWGLVYLTLGLIGAVAAAAVLTIRNPIRHTVATEEGSAPPDFVPFVKRNWPALLIVLGPFIMGTYLATGTAAWLPLMLIRRFGLDTADAAQLSGVVVLVVSSVGTIVGGVFGDFLARRGAGGRFLVLRWFGPALLSLVVFCLTSNLVIAIGALLLFKFTVAVITLSVFPMIPEIVPSSMRGGMLGLYMVVLQIFGMALGTSMVGFVSEYVIGDPAMLNVSMLIAMAPAWFILMICGVVGMRYYRELSQRYGEAGSFRPVA